MKRCLPAVAASFLTSCGLPAPAPASLLDSPQAPVLKAFEEWAAPEGHQPLQKECRSRAFPAKGSPKGTVLLFHGFTACPQQFFELAPLLAEAGFHVLLPLLPGHGRVPENGADAIDDLPSPQTRQRYQTFVESLNAVLRDEPGERAVGGLSLGAALAAAAYGKEPSLYHRALLAVPLFEASPGLVPALVTGVGSLPFVNNVRVGWGPACHVAATLGRAGYCDFRLKHLMATVGFGEDVITELASGGPQVQILGVENDPVVSLAPLTKVLDGAAPGSSGCLLPPNVNHSLFSRFDSPRENKSWIPDLLQRTAAFLTEGQPFAQSGASSHPRFGRCAPSL